jgi:phosphate:Na+ symporter
VERLHLIIAGLTAVILFIYGLESFSQEIQRVSGERFRRFVGQATRLPVIGVVIGALVTAVIQSSSATSVIAIGLVNAGVLSFKNSVGVIFGSNVGTTITAQLVAFKLTAFAPVFIIVGFLLSLLRTRLSAFGKTLFFFGFVFFSLNLISSSLAPLQNDPAFTAWLIQPQNPLLAILVGALVTAVLQSSSVTTGLAIIFVQQGLMSLENAVPLIMGANIGTTATALIAMFSMDIAAKKTALSHFLFNVGGVVIFTPLLFLYGDRLNALGSNPAIALANIHLAFNIGTTIVFLLFIGPFTRLVDRLLGEGRMDFQRIEIPRFDEGSDFSALRVALKQELCELMNFLRENYRLVSLSIETNYESLFDAASKRIDYARFLERELLGFFARVVPLIESEQESRELMRIAREYDYLFQIDDSIDDLFTVKKVLSEHYIEPGGDILMLVRELSSGALVLFDDVQDILDGGAGEKLQANTRELNDQLDRAYRRLLVLTTNPERKDAGTLFNFVTYNRRLMDKLLNFALLQHADPGRENRPDGNQSTPASGQTA